MLSVYNNGQGIVVWPAKSQVTKVLPRENYYARGEDVGGGWYRNTHLPCASPSGPCSHLQFHQLTHICPHVLHSLFRVKASDWLSFRSAQTLNITHCNPHCVTVTVSPALLGIPPRTFGGCTSGIERTEGGWGTCFLEKLEREYASAKRKEKKVQATTRQV